MGDDAPQQPARTARVDATRFGVVVLVGALLWLVPTPDGVEPRAWQLLALPVPRISEAGL
jgi:hypothetical protein